MSRNVQGIVAVIFVVLALSFIATTAVLYIEFRDDGWFTFAAFYSHLFIFFPTFGILALCAFYVPACALLDLYWNHVRHGPIRFAVASFLLVAVSMGVSSMLVTGVPAMWWLKPETLNADRGNPAGCAAPQCKRLPVMESVEDVRTVSSHRLGLSPFVRECVTDLLMELPPEQVQPRHCFVTKTKLTAAQCCIAQKQFTDDLTKLYESERGNHSVTGLVHAKLLPMKIFFLLMILAIGILLALWRRTIDKHYQSYTGHIERGLLIGALAMLLWPVSNHGFLQSSSVLYGRSGEGVYATISPILSFMFAAWALLLVVFFFRRHERDIEAAGKIGGGIASAVAIMKYDVIIDFATRFLGSGADPVGLSVLAVLLVLCFVALYAGNPERGFRRKPQPEPTANKSDPV
jgi:hypothetical protein